MQLDVIDAGSMVDRLDRVLIGLVVMPSQVGTIIRMQVSLDRLSALGFETDYHVSLFQREYVSGAAEEGFRGFLFAFGKGRVRVDR